MRRRFGAGALVVGVAAAAVLLASRAAWPLVLLVALPFFAGALGLLQARGGT